MVLSVLSPHECAPFADTALNAPDGALVRPLLLSPQQVMVLSVLSPHECVPLADTALNAPDGALVRPLVLSSR